MPRLKEIIGHAAIAVGLGHYVAYRGLRRRFHGLVIGRRCDISSGSTFGHFVELAEETTVYKSQLGDHTYMAPRASVQMAQLGRYCSVGPAAMIGLAQHPTQDFVSTHPKFYRRYAGAHPSFVDHDYFQGHLQTTVGNDVWVGAAAMIKSGLRIGDGAIIGAGAVVTKDAEPYGIYAGVPAKLIRFRFDEETVQFLLKFRWWDRGDEWLKSHVTDFHDVDAFVAKHCDRTASFETPAAAAR